MVDWHEAEMENVSGSGSLKVSGMGSCHRTWRSNDIPSHNIQLKLRQFHHYQQLGNND